MPDIVQDQDFYFQIIDWKGGLFSNLSYHKSPISSLNNCSNSQINKRESLSRRPTFTETGHFNYPTVAGTPAAIIWIGPTSTYTKRALVTLHWTSSAGIIEVYDGTTWSQGGGAAFTTTESNLTNLVWVRESSGTEFIYAPNASGNANKWTISATPSSSNIDGTVNSNVPQKCQFLISFLDRL